MVFAPGTKAELPNQVLFQNEFPATLQELLREFGGTRQGNGWKVTGQRREGVQISYFGHLANLARKIAAWPATSVAFVEPNR